MDKPWNLAPMDLSKYIKELRPNKSTTEQLNDAIEKLVDKFKENLSITIGRIGLAGSWGKSTSTQDDTSVNLLLFITDLRAIDDHSKRLPSILNELREYLKKDKYTVKMENDDAKQYVSILFPISDDIVTCNIFPSVDLLGATPTQANIGTFYRKLVTVSDRSPYNATTLEMQSRLIKGTPVYLHDLLRLVSVWQTSKLQLRGGAPLPELFELVALYRWSEAGSPIEFDIRKGFLDVMKTLSDWSELQVIWGGTLHGRYDKTVMEEVAKRKHICLEDTPLVMDPVDPFVNYCSGIRRLVWEEIERIARETANDPVLNGIEDTANWL